ncbi:hypothetical protein ACN28S_48395 [Cystobacter fuscus]
MVGAIIFLVVDFLALPLLLGGLSDIASYVFYAPGTWGSGCSSTGGMRWGGPSLPAV